MIVYTIGHSTRSIEDFIALLHAHGVVQLADVRTIPKSRRHPHFAQEALSGSLPVAGISYRHFPGLGGLRKPASDSPNGGWRHAGFRGYADYMQTPAFADALRTVVDWSGGAPTAIMCAEAVWWQCHRQLIADALLARGIEVRHITTAKAAAAHTLTSFARVDGPRVTYPGLV
jgi:uncharacterized protein (DUF488 family)